MSDDLLLHTDDTYDFVRECLPNLHSQYPGSCDVEITVTKDSPLSGILFRKLCETDQCEKWSNDHKFDLITEYGRYRNAFVKTRQKDVHVHGLLYTYIVYYDTFEHNEGLLIARKRQMRLEKVDG
jgi:hypothetical protein